MARKRFLADLTCETARADRAFLGLPLRLSPRQGEAAHTPLPPGFYVVLRSLDAGGGDRDEGLAWCGPFESRVIAEKLCTSARFLGAAPAPSLGVHVVPAPYREARGMGRPDDRAKGWLTGT